MNGETHDDRCCMLSDPSSPDPSCPGVEALEAERTSGCPWCRICGSCDAGLPMSCTCGECTCEAPCGHPRCAHSFSQAPSEGPLFEQRVPKPVRNPLQEPVDCEPAW